jgi:hypothetical protein
MDCDWSRKELLKFPKLDTYLMNEKKRQKELFNSVVEKQKNSYQKQVDSILSRYDVEINLKRQMFSNQRYLGIGRNKPKSSFFSPFVMNRILNDAMRIARQQKQPQNQNSKSYSQYSLKEDDKLLKSLEHHFASDVFCDRFRKNTNGYENRKFMKLIENLPQEILDDSLRKFKENMYNHQASDANLNEYSSDSFLLEQFKDESQTTMKNFLINTQELADLDEIIKENTPQKSRHSDDINEKFLVNSQNENLNDKSRVHLPTLVLKPKTQEVSSQLKSKLPKIHSKEK